MGKAKLGLRAVALASVGALALSACGGGSSAGGGGSSGDKPAAGGTIYMLTHDEQYNSLDPQVMYTGEDLALFGATIFRSLTGYVVSPDDAQAVTVVPDLATDTGRSSNNNQVWEFTLVDGATFQDGSAITCADVKYGVSRTFATDVIQGGPTYAIQYLDIPQKDGASVYKGPYTTKNNDTAAFDKAVVCSTDNKTITFNLNKPVPDFNYTVTLGFSPVPKSADTDPAKYGLNPVASGPYMIEKYKTGKGGSLTLVRNPKWSQASDTYRTTNYPDQWVTQFGLDDTVIDQRLIASSGPDATAVSYAVQPASLSTVFDNPTYENRRINALDPYSSYYAIDVQKVPNQKHRAAIAAALDRTALAKNAGGATYVGDPADGVIKPNMPLDYQPSGIWDGLLGAPIPGEGNVDLAKQLIADSGEPMPTIKFNYAQSDVGDKAAGIIVSSEARAGIKIVPAPLESGAYYGIIFDPAKRGEMYGAGWGPDWPNASTIIPPLFTKTGGWNLSAANDPAFDKAVDAALVEPDRTKQGQMWADLNKQAMQNVWVVPRTFTKTQRLAGTDVGPVYLWAAYGSWPYGAMYAKTGS